MKASRASRVESRGLEHSALHGPISGARPSTLDARTAGAFTLVEIMVVVAILGIVMAMGVPSIVRAMRREGMRKAVADIVDVCTNARAQAIMRGDTMELQFRAEDNGFSVQGAAGGGHGGETEESGSRGAQSAGAGFSAHLPENIAIAELRINGLDYMEASEARVHFYPNGTCDDFVIALLSEQREIRRITLEITTGLAEVEVVQ